MQDKQSDREKATVAKAKLKKAAIVIALLSCLSAPIAAKVYYSGNDTMQIVDGSLHIGSDAQRVEVIEEEEEEAIDGVFDPFKSDKGLAIPNQPLNMPFEVREQMRSMVENYIKDSKMRLGIIERDSLNALFFNYGLQVLEDGKVIILDTYVPGAMPTKPMLTDTIPLPESSLQIVRDNDGADEGSSIVDDLNNPFSSPSP